VSPPTKVLFVCLHGAAKSVIAAEYFRRRAAAADLDVEVTSAGVEPDAEVPPPVVSGLAEEGFDVTGLIPPLLHDTDLVSADVIVSFGCDIEDRVQSRSVIRWDDVPLVSDGYLAARDEIVRRVDALVAGLASERVNAPRD
jgi:arsenate reductase (thioredoxin)